MFFLKSLTSDQDVRNMLKAMKLSILDFIQNHVFRQGTFLAAITTYLHWKYPEFRSEIDSSLAAVLAAMRG